MQGTHVTYDTSCHRMKGFLSFFLNFFLFRLPSGKLFLSFPIVFYPAEVGAQPHSTVWTGLIFKECLEATWGQANTLHVAVARVSSQRGKHSHNLASQGHCTVLWIRQQAQARSGCSRSSEISWWKPWPIPSHLSQCYNSCSSLLPLCLTVSKESCKDLKTSFANGCIFLHIIWWVCATSFFCLCYSHKGSWCPMIAVLNSEWPKIMWRAWIRGPDTRPNLRLLKGFTKVSPNQGALSQLYFTRGKPGHIPLTKNLLSTEERRGRQAQFKDMLLWVRVFRMNIVNFTFPH